MFADIFELLQKYSEDNQYTTTWVGNGTIPQTTDPFQTKMAEKSVVCRVF